LNSHLVVVADPNGCGKTTFVREYLESFPYPYISADDIAETMDSDSIDDVRFEAGREFFTQAAAHLSNGDNFIVESTLSGLMFKKVLNKTREASYDISILSIFLGSPEACVARIQERVRKGGHSIPEEDVRRRFPRSIINFWNTYRTFANRWHLFYNGGVQFHEVALGEGDIVEIRDEDLFEVFLNLAQQKDG
jgi:predicted ABC-type ATPase